MAIRNALLFAVLLVFFILITPSGTAVAEEHQCNPKGELDFCIKQFETNKNTVTKGNVVEGTVDITNTGNKSGSVVIMIGMKYSENEYAYHRLGVLHDLKPGETQSYEFQLEAREDSSVGEHRMNVRIMDLPEKHLYDATGYTSSTYLEKDPLTVSEILENFNSFSVGLSALIGIIAYFLGKHRLSLR